MSLANLLIWAVYWLGSFCVLESLAALRTYTRRYLHFEVPWDTFSRFIWDAQLIRYIGVPVTLLVLFVLSTLITHLPNFKNLSEGDKEKEPHEGQ